MRVLWFTNTPSNYKSSTQGYNGGGWISSLENELKKRENIKLGICFLNHKDDTVRENRVNYYAIKYPRFYNIRNAFNNKFKKEQEQAIINKCLKAITDFQPDIIHIFGTEKQYGLIASYTNIPIVLHIQGILTPCLNAYLPPFISWTSFYWKKKNIVSFFKAIKEKKYWERNARREQYIIKYIHNYIGRTQWDKRIIKTLNPQCKYYHGDEILRETFYLPTERVIPELLTIVTTISSPLYKGFDLVLKTALILKKYFHLKFKWIIFGNINPIFIEKITNIHHKNVFIELKGVGTAEDIKNAISHCTVFVHPSYIDNSPNSIGEAQLLKCTVIATNVGGIPSLIKNNETGYLVPANDPYQTAYLIDKIFNNPSLNLQIGENAQKEATQRHNKEKIVNDLIITYQHIINSK